MQLSDYRSDLRLLIHDANGADFTDATLNGFINQSRTRVAIDTQCVQTYIDGLNTITQQEQYPLTGFVGGVAVTAGGVGYTNPTVTIGAPGGGGVTATASAVVTAGIITGINTTNWGTLYTSVPAVTIHDPSGHGASAVAVAGLNIINWLQPVDLLWGNLRINFNYLDFLTFNTFPRAYQNQFSRSGVFTVHLGNQKGFLYPIPDQPYPMAINASIVPSPLVNDSDVDNQVIAPWSDAVNQFAAHLCYSSIQNLGMADYYYTGAVPGKPLGKYDIRVRQLPASVTPYRVTNPYILGRKRIRRM